MADSESTFVPDREENASMKKRTIFLRAWNSDPLDRLGRGRGFELGGSDPIQRTPKKAHDEAAPTIDLDAEEPGNDQGMIDQLMSEYGGMTEADVDSFHTAILQALEMGQQKWDSCNAQAGIADAELHAAETGQFDVRDKVGQQFSRYMRDNPEFKQHYKGLNMPQKRKQREEWAKAPYLEPLQA